MKKKILKIVLGFVFSFSLAFAAFAKEEKKEFCVKYEYLNKDMGKTPKKGVKNKTSEKEFLNAYVLLKKLYKELEIDNSSLKKWAKDVATVVFKSTKDIKLEGVLDVALTPKELTALGNFLGEKDFIGKKLKNEELFDVSFTKKEFLKAQEEIVEIIKDSVKKEKDKKVVEILENRIKKIKAANFNEVLNLTKDLRVERILKV